ncbi:hypothetical protein FMZ60_10575 [Alcaligenaceae bacterium SJ-26]|nr:hypothetical protein FMZ60_10575 [Alcaligenaceae bacterium SJ-26]
MQAAVKTDDQAASPNRQELLSAWMDGEHAGPLPDVLHTAAGRTQWEAWHLIGDVLRSEQLSAGPSARFRANMAAALEQEAVIVSLSRRQRFARAGLSGLAVAAAVATVVWIAQPYMVTPSPDNTRILAEASTGPVEAADASKLHGYLDAHRQFAGSGMVQQASYGVPR